MKEFSMKRVLSIVLLASSLSGLLSASEFDIGISGSDRGISGFSLSIGDYYRVPAREIIAIERFISRDETSVVYFLSQHSHKHPRYITDMRLRGMSWWDISIRLGLDPYTLYVVNTSRHSGPPYGRAYGYHASGRNYRLQDRDIVELVNVRFLSSYYNVSADEIIDRRSKGQHYIHIDDDYRAQKYSRNQKNERREHQYKEQKNNKNKHDDRGHGNKNRDDR
jgi:hypothetical protein